MSQAHVNRIENGKPEYNLKKLIHWANILGIPADLLWFKMPETSEQPDFAPIVNDSAVVESASTIDRLDERDEVLRREFLATSLAAGISAIVPSSVIGQRIGSGAVAHLRHRVARLRRLDDFLGGADTYELYNAELESLKHIYKRHSFTEETGQELLGIIAEQAQQAGWAAFDSGRRSESKRLFEVALTSAQQANDSSLVANSLAYVAYQEVSAGESGVDTAIASCDAASRDAPSSVQALLLERLAWAHAKAGQSGEAERALGRAAEILSDGNGALQPDWSSWVDGREIKIMSGRCWAELHRPMRSVLALEDALADFADTHARDKALYLSWLADAYLDVGEVEQSASIVSRALDLATGVGSIRPWQRIREVSARLDPHRNISAVREVLDRVVE